jgi:hypothetical protein
MAEPAKNLETTPEPASVHDVAAFILREHGPVTAMKLQKLVY